MALTNAQIEHALKAKAGNIAAAARELGVSRSTVYRRIDGNAALKQLVTDTREELVDIAESALRREVIEGNITAIIFTLKTLGKQRGYVERSEVTGAAGGAIETKAEVKVDLSGLTTEQLTALAASLEE